MPRSELKHRAISRAKHGAHFHKKKKGGMLSAGGDGRLASPSYADSRFSNKTGKSFRSQSRSPHSPLSKDMQKVGSSLSPSFAQPLNPGRRNNPAHRAHLHDGARPATSEGRAVGRRRKSEKLPGVGSSLLGFGKPK